MSKKVLNPANASLKVTIPLIDMLKFYEGFRSCPYWDANGKKWTVGYGHTRTAEDLRRKNVCITEPQAVNLKMLDLTEFEDCVKETIRIPLTQGQFNAQVSFSYNMGCARYRRSNVVKLLNANKVKDAANELLKFNRSGGRVLAGLTKRRNSERTFMLEGTGLADNDVPMLVDNYESSLADAFQTTSSKGIEFIKQREGFHPTAYWDVRQWSIGYGTSTNNKNERIDEIEAERRLRQRLRDDFEPCVNSIGRKLPQGVYDALVSVAYNMGCGGLKRTQLWRDTVAGKDGSQWFTNVRTCCNVAGKWHKGVAKRREKEQALYRSSLPIALPTMLSNIPAWQYAVMGVVGAGVIGYIAHKKGYV